VLRPSGLGPAPQRIGPGWFEFLRAQAQCLIGGRGAPARRRPTTTSPQPRLGSTGRLLSCRKSGPPPGSARCPGDAKTVAPAAGASMARSRRTPKSGSTLVPQPRAQTRRHVKSVAPASAQTTASHPSQRAQIVSPAAQAPLIGRSAPSCQPRTEFLYPHKPQCGRMALPRECGKREECAAASVSTRLSRTAEGRGGDRHADDRVACATFGSPRFRMLREPRAYGDAVVNESTSTNSASAQSAPGQSKALRNWSDSCTNARARADNRSSPRATGTDGTDRKFVLRSGSIWS
jgi:hypothetical protein